jgi:hypothetical protein
VTANSRWLDARRAAAWKLGVELRERLLETFMDEEGLRSRPLIKEVADDLVREVQGARLRDDCLPLDRFAQSEVVGGRIEVTINSRIGEISGVKDPVGTRTVAVLHEAVHVDRDLRPVEPSLRRQPALPGLEDDGPRLIVCRSAGSVYRSSQPEREFIAENAALAAAIAWPDLRRCAAFVEFRRRAAEGGDLGGAGWCLLYETAAFIGVNISALVTYFGHRGLCHVVREGGGRRLIAAPPLFRVDESLEPVTWTSRSVA